MTRLQRFNICTSGGYDNTDKYVSWKIVDEIMYFQCSREIEDWKRNFDIRPVKTWISGFDATVPHGFDSAYQEIAEIIATHPVTGFCGYSHGATIAARAGADTGKRTVVFGCPNFLLSPSKEVLDSFWNVEFVQNPRDIVTLLPPVYRKGRNIIKLSGVAIRDYVPIWQWVSGHTPNEYRQRMTNV